MSRMTGPFLAILLIPTVAYPEPPSFPFDLSKWIRTEPPMAGDDRWFAANNDASHAWVVYLSKGRPSVRLRAVKREPGSPYPGWQESYPPMPFAVRQEPMNEGLAGEWFSAQVSDGWIIGFNKGEWGGALWWYSPDGTRRYKISGDQVLGFLRTEAGLLALEGIAHINVSRGRIVRLTRDDDGRWHSRPFIGLGGCPQAAALAKDGSLMVATSDHLFRVDLAARKVEVLLVDTFWGGLSPRSMILAPTGTIYLGMRHGVAEVKRVGEIYKVTWLVPSREFERSASERMREGIR